MEIRKVCDGCWKRGRCESLTCKCSCTDPRYGWNHTDDPRIGQEFALDPEQQY